MLFKNLIRSDFIRNVSTLITGTSIAQVLPLAISPILTRIYSPEEFGLLAIYLSLASVLGVVATARYELAIVQPVKECDALSIVILSLVITVFLSVLVLVLVVLFDSIICDFLGTSTISDWLLFLPLSVFIMGSYQSLNYFAVRKKEFKKIALANVLQAGSGGGGQVALAYLKGSGGLIIGNILGALISLFMLAPLLIESFRKNKKKVHLNQIANNAKQYSDFPKYSLLGAFSNSAAQQAPVLFISKSFDASTVGIFSLVTRVVSVPVSLVSSGLSQVVYERVSFYRNNSPAKIRPFLLSIFLILFLIMIPFVLLMNIFGDELFAFAFGEPWRFAGELSGIVAFAVAIRFAVSPLSVILSLEGNVFLGMLWQVLYFLTLCVTLYFLFGVEMELFLIGFVIHEILLYLIFLAFIFKGVEMTVSGVDGY